jgi:uncharacterized caspase-like protein
MRNCLEALNTFSHGYALLIGVGRYQHVPSLPMAARDAQALHAVLTDPTRCAYPRQNIRLLKDEEVTLATLKEGLHWLAAQVSRDREATAVVFFSGHGCLHKDQYYLVPHDLNPEDVASSALSGHDFNRALDAINAQRLLVILDCCHAGGIAIAKGDGLQAKAPPQSMLDELNEGTGRAIFSSSRDSQRSWGPASSGLSLYTHHLIEALEGTGTLPGETVIRLSHLMNHVGDNVKRSAQRMGREQNPFFSLSSEDFPVSLVAGGKGTPCAPSAHSAAADLDKLLTAAAVLEDLPRTLLELLAKSQELTRSINQLLALTPRRE